MAHSAWYDIATVLKFYQLGFHNKNSSDRAMQHEDLSDIFKKHEAYR